MELECNGCTLQDSRIRNNGTPYNVSIHEVADGVGISGCSDGLIRNNEITNNTDVNLVIGGRGGSGNCQTYGNVITQTVLGQVGLAVVDGDHPNSRVYNNQIYSGYEMLAIGLVVGDHPWTPNQSMGNGGMIDSNHIDGSVILAAIDGVQSGTFTNNTGANRQGVFPWQPCQSVPYTAGDYGSMSLQSGHVFQTYHNSACQF